MCLQTNGNTAMIKVLLALHSPDRRKLWRGLIEQEPCIELIGEVEDPVDLLVEVTRTQVDAVIQEWPSEETPGFVSILLTEYPDLLVVGIPENGAHAFLCRQAISKKQLPTADLHDVLSEVQRRVPALR
jgi:hypothetical protein